MGISFDDLVGRPGDATGASGAVSFEDLVGAPAADDLLQQVVEFGKGVAPGAVRLGLEVEAAEGPRLATLHFEGIKVRVPQCGDWSRPTHYNPTNALAPDFGCATRRNLGLMVANPAHLVGPAPLGLRDTARSDLIIGKYRRGEVTGAEKAPEEKVKVSEEISE